MTHDKPIPDAELEELDRLREVAKLGPMVSVHITSPGYEHCANLCTRLEGHKSDYPVAMMQATWADVLAAEHNAYGPLRQRLLDAESRLAEADRLPELQLKHAELAVELFNADARLEKAAEQG